MNRIEDLTLEEIAWRYEMLNDTIDDMFESKAVDFAPEDKGIFRFEELVCGALIYLSKIGAINIILHKRGHNEGALFTATRKQCEKTAWEEPSEAREYDRPSHRDLPIPNLFLDEGYDKYTHISLIFEYPDTAIGRFCERMMGYLRQACKKDVDVINAAVFMHCYCDGNSYGKIMRRSMYRALMDDEWTSSLQCPDAVEEVLKMVMEEYPKKLYDPFMRTGYNMFFSDGEYYGQGTDRYHFYASMLFAGIWDLDVEHRTFEDCTENWNPRDCDMIIASPEFKQEVTLDDGKKEPIGSWVMEKVYSALVSGTPKALLLLPSSVLSASGKYERLRHDITNSNLLDTVVLLPDNLFPGTGIAATIILLKSDRETGAPITFADFTALTKIEDEWEDETKPELDSDLVSKAIEESNPKYICEVTSDNIKERDYEWYVPKYINKQTEVPNGYIRLKVLDLIQEIGTYQIGSSIKNYVVEAGDLCADPFEEYGVLQTRSMSEMSKDDKEDDYSFLDQECFVIDFHDTIKTYYHGGRGRFDFGRLAVPRQYSCFRVNVDETDLGYLRMILKDVYETVKSSAKETDSYADKHWAFMCTEVVVPISIDEQKRLYEQAKMNVVIEKARKEGLDEAIDRMKQEYMVEVRMRKHDMKPFLSQLDSQAKLISFYMDKIEGNEGTVSKIREKLLGISNAVSELRLHLNRLTEEDIYGIPEVTNPLTILKELTGSFNNYTVKLEVDEIALKEAGIDEPQIYISPVDLSTLASTIIENAVSHAFTDPQGSYNVVISFTYDKEKEMFIIDFKNDGAAMPEGMDKFRYGLKGEKGVRSHGSGLGGYRVKSITRHYCGDYNVFCNRTLKHTTIRVELPKYRKDEKI